MARSCTALRTIDPRRSRNGPHRQIRFALAALVAHVHDTGAEPSRRGAAQRDRALDLRKEARSGAQHHGMHEQPVLVDQASPDERCGQGGTADVHVAVELLPHALELLGDIAAHQPAVVVDRVERRREDDPWRRRPDPGEIAHRLGGVGIGLGVRPVRRHQLVHAATVEGRSEPTRLIVEPGVQFVVDVRPGERVVGRLDEAVERDVEGVDQLAHRQTCSRVASRTAGMTSAASRSIIVVPGVGRPDNEGVDP